MRQLSQIYLLLLLVTPPLSGCTTISYYGQAIGGHVSLMMKARPIHQVITAPETDPELRRQLELAAQARAFAAQELALPVDDVFSEYVALGRPWVVVNLVAVPEFSLTPPTSGVIRLWAASPIAGTSAWPMPGRNRRPSRSAITKPLSALLPPTPPWLVR